MYACEYEMRLYGLRIIWVEVCIRWKMILVHTLSNNVWVILKCRLPHQCIESSDRPTETINIVMLAQLISAHLLLFWGGTSKQMVRKGKDFGRISCGLRVILRHCHGLQVFLFRGNGWINGRHVDNARCRQMSVACNFSNMLSVLWRWGTQCIIIQCNSHASGGMRKISYEFWAVFVYVCVCKFVYVAPSAATGRVE